MKRTLYLILKKEPFDRILSGKKVTEYRDKTDYWSRRLDDKLFDYVHFRHGYSKTARCMLVEHLGMYVSDRYEIKLGKVVETENIYGSE
jgi:hypothetical protein